METYLAVSGMETYLAVSGHIVVLGRYIKQIKNIKKFSGMRRYIL
jgi:hypothetical protein